MKTQITIGICVSFIIGFLVGNYHYIFGVSLPTVSDTIWASIIGAIISVCGWFAVFRAQNNKIKFDITNEARVKIGRGIIAYQQWLIEMSHEIYRFYYGSGDSEKTKELLSREPREWLNALEEYQIMFPETIKVKQQLMERAADIVDFVFSDTLYFDPPGGALRDNNEYFDIANTYFFHQGMLMGDLMSHFQNVCMGEIGGNRIKYGDFSCKRPVITVGRDGNLEIRNNTDPISQRGLNRMSTEC